MSDGDAVPVTFLQVGQAMTFVPDEADAGDPVTAPGPLGDDPQ